MSELARMGPARLVGPPTRVGAWGAALVIVLLGSILTRLRLPVGAHDTLYAVDGAVFLHAWLDGGAEVIVRP